MSERPAPRSGRLAEGVDEIRSLVVRTREVVIVCAVVGTVTGFGVALLDALTLEVLMEAVRSVPLWAQMLAPGLGLVITALLLRTLGGGTGPATTEDYVKAVPHPDAPFDLRVVPARLLGALATLGLGGAGGLEGPSLYLGTAVGAGAFERVRRWVRGVDRRALLVAGAAAGVAAVFRAPATGAVYALEVPFQDDMAPRSLLPALVGGASGYTAFAVVHGTDRLIPVEGQLDLALTDLALAAAIGLACGVGARAFAWVMGVAKRISETASAPLRVGVAAVALGAMAVGTHHLFDGQALSLGPGYEAVEYAMDPDRGLVLLVVLATVRVAATAATFAGGGVAGMFVPLVIQGALTGRLLAGAVDAESQSLCVVLGVAAFLGAGYRVPLAAVMFTAEATGRPGFVVPALIASTIGQIVMGRASVSANQRRRRSTYIEQRADLPIESVLSTDPAVARATDSVAEFFTEHVALARRQAVPVVDDGGVYEGLVVLDDVLHIDPEAWPTTDLASVARTDVPLARPDWTLGDALRAMLDGDVDHLPVVGHDGRLRGVVTGDAIIDRAALAEQLEGGDPTTDGR